MGYLYIVLAAACWALIGPVSRLAFVEGVAPLEVAFWRAALGGVLFGAHVVVRRPPRVARADLPAMALFGLLGVALFYGAYLLAVEEGGAALAAVLLYTAPAWVALMSALWLAEPMTARKLTAVGLTVAGVAGIALGGGGAMRVTVGAVAWGLVAGWCYALYYPFGKRYFARYAPAAVYALALPVGALALLPFVAFVTKTAVAWAALGWLSVCSTYLAYLFYALGLQRLEATRASIVATLEPVIAAGFAYLWWDERFGLWGYLGAVLILTGVLLSVAAPRRLLSRPTASDVIPHDENRA